MSICIYRIVCEVDNRCYVGKTINSNHRFMSHRRLMRRKTRSPDCNRYLWDAAQAYGIEAFRFEIVEEFTEIDEIYIAMRELHWIGHFKSCEEPFGYNLRRDSRTKMIVHPDTRMLMSGRYFGEKNPNFGKKWSAEKKKHMSDLKIKWSADNPQPRSQRLETSIRSSKQWRDPVRRAAMAAKVMVARRKWTFRQLDRDGNLIRVWDNVKEIVAVNPGYKWQNIYGVCNGYKKTYMGFVWEKVARHEN